MSGSQQTVDHQIDKRLEQAFIVAEALEQAGFKVDIIVCKDGLPCLIAHKKEK